MNAPPPAPRGMRLVNRLLVTIVAAGLATGVIGAVLLQRTARDSALDDARERTQLVATQYAVRLDSNVESLLATLRLASTRRELTGFGPAAAEELAVILRVSPAFDELVLFDRTGEPVAAAASRFLADPSDYLARPDLVIGVETGVDVAVDSTSPAAVELAVGVESPPGQIRGALLARSRLDVIAAPLEESLEPDDPVPFLVGAGGDVLVHRDRSRVGVGAFPIDRLVGSGGQDRFEVDGEQRLFAAARADRLGTQVVVEQPEAVALAPVEDRRVELMVILVAATTAMALAVAIAGEVLLRPLRPLTHAVGRVGRGERGVSTDVRATAELGVLASEIDRMAESLDRRDEQLSELREVSLLVGALADRADVARRVADGATRLVRGDAAAVVASDGEDVEALAGTHRVEAPLVGSDGAALGSLRVVREAGPFTDEEAELLATFATFASVALDNARRLEMQQELVEQLQAAVDQRRDLIGTVTHEFRTPLACIEGFTSELLAGWEDYGDDDRKDLIARIRHHGNELDELVGRFLDFAVTERGGMVAALESLSLIDVVDLAVSTLAPLLADRRVEVDVAPILVTGDQALLRRTLTNLLSNAVKYSSPGSAVCIRARATVDVAEVAVIDEGIGMEGADLERAFEPFWRGGAATTRSTRGAGLGLALVAEYVRVMGGRVRAEATPGRGSTFTFTLPLAGVPSVGAGGGDG